MNQVRTKAKRVSPCGHTKLPGMLRRFFSNLTQRDRTEKAVSLVLLMSAAFSLIALAVITLFVVREGWPVIFKYGPFKLIGGADWTPGKSQFGMLPQLVGTLMVTLGALLFSLPFGVGTAVFLSELAPRRLADALRPAVALLAAVPSVVYGFFGVVVMVPVLRRILGGSGYSLFGGAVILALMTLPTIISISEDSLRAVPRDFREASLALGSTGWQTIWRALIPSAKSGIVVSVILAMGRAVGETMAVMMVTGNRPLVPGSIFQMGPTMAGTIGQEWGYAAGDHAGALFALGTFLFILIMILNGAAQLITGRGRNG